MDLTPVNLSLALTASFCIGMALLIRTNDFKSTFFLRVLPGVIGFITLLALMQEMGYLTISIP